MSRRSGVAGALCLAVITLSAYAEALTMQQLASQIGKDSIIHAEFTQTRKLAVLKRPVVSSGKMVVAGGQGVIWEIERPYRATYIIVRDAVAEVDEKGQRKSGQAGQAQHIRHIANLIGSLLELDEKVLAEHFTILVEGEADQWTVHLAPRDAVARFITKLILRGGSFVDEVTILETSGDSSSLQFHSSRKGGTLSSRERMLLQGR